jgi:hypothetical protein
MKRILIFGRYFVSLGEFFTAFERTVGPLSAVTSMIAGQRPNLTFGKTLMCGQIL